jgi:soluble lytic murein transglycosylase-like protein
MQERRATPRAGRDRRRGERRRARLRSFLFAALTLAIPSRLTRSAQYRFEPHVSVSIDNAVPVPKNRAYDGIIAEAAAAYRLEPALIKSVMSAESGFDPWAVSRAGARGLMQLMPEMARAFGVSDIFDPRENVMAGARLLRELLDQHHGNVRLAIASYNAGPTAVAHYGGVVPPFRETQRYVKRVTSLIAAARAAN